MICKFKDFACSKSKDEWNCCFRQQYSLLKNWLAADGIRAALAGFFLGVFVVSYPQTTIFVVALTVLVAYLLCYFSQEGAACCSSGSCSSSPATSEGTKNSEMSTSNENSTSLDSEVTELATEKKSNSGKRKRKSEDDQN